MKTLGIILLIIYLVVTVLAVIIQILISMTGDQTTLPWGMILKQSFGWPAILIKLIFGA